MSTRLNKGFLTHTITNLHCFFKFPQTGRSRGFGFVYYESSDDAREVGYLTVTISLKSQRDSCNMITFLTVQLITESCFFFQLNCNLFSVVVVHEGSYYQSLILQNSSTAYQDDSLWMCSLFLHPQAKQCTNGLEIDSRRIRVDFSITKRAHTPTPGVYMGKATQ